MSMGVYVYLRKGHLDEYIKVIMLIYIIIIIKSCCLHGSFKYLSIYLSIYLCLCVVMHV